MLLYRNAEGCKLIKFTLPHRDGKAPSNNRNFYVSCTLKVYKAYYEISHFANK